MRKLALLAAALLAAPSPASAAAVLYGISFVGTDFNVENVDREYFNSLPKGFAGTFTFDTATNELLDFRAFEVPDYSIEPAVFEIFNAAGPCDINCFTTALETGSFSYNYITYRTTITFGAPLNGTAIRTTPASSGRPIIANGFITVNGAIPEPGTWLTMLLGFGVIGASLRRTLRAKPRLSAAT